jgi:hypothetical protein
VSWWEVATLGGLVVIGWVLTGRVLITQSRMFGELRERVAFLEARVNGLRREDGR